MRLSFDHIAVTAATRGEGVAWVRDRLGVTVPPGGSHPRMGTHNALMRLGNDEFLEVIAVDPAVPVPDEPRWFGLDHPQVAPRIGNWIVRCDDIDAALAALPGCCGPAITMTRGDLRWRIAVPGDGGLPFGGGFPTLLEWPARPFPGAAMPDLSCGLDRLTISHPRAPLLAQLLDGFLNDPRVVFSTAPGLSISAVISTPDGMRSL